MGCTPEFWGNPKNTPKNWGIFQRFLRPASTPSVDAGSAQGLSHAMTRTTRSDTSTALAPPEGSPSYCQSLSKFAQGATPGHRLVQRATIRQKGHRPRRGCSGGYSCIWDFGPGAKPCKFCACSTGKSRIRGRLGVWDSASGLRPSDAFTSHTRYKTRTSSRLKKFPAWHADSSSILVISFFSAEMKTSIFVGTCESRDFIATIAIHGFLVIWALVG